VAVTSNEQWRSLCGVVGKPELGDDPKLATVEGRRAVSDVVDGHISAWTREMTVYEAMDRLQAVGVPAGPSMNGVDVFHDPHLESRGFFVTHTTNEGREARLPGLPWQLRPGPEPKVLPAPDLGQHNQDLLSDILGLSTDEIQALVDEQVVY
jgi:crotonobetainyl-CoA:carnitine CoA-transferase CaiB-like acyl-CoA transferase